MAIRVGSMGRSGRSGYQSRHRLNADINVTPLVDVMLVLLIVFMVASKLFNSGVDVELPKTDANALTAEQDPITISVDKTGKVFLQDEELNVEILIERLVAISTNGYDERIYLQADEDSDYGAVMKVMSAVNVAGFTNLGLVTQPEAQPK
jgi:biopolymer transport protein TolR